ncbi:MAG: hypothetical protein IPK81_02020 [Rhodospirillales bacterium]|nr:MAG: hypothetical protein IPK81_02020 [Rhodospirillales bacterium]
MRSLRNLIATAVAAAALAACGDNPEAASTYTPKYARADRSVALHGVTFAPGQAAMAPGERAQLMAFARESPAELTSITVVTSREEPSLQALRAAAVRDAVQGAGVRVVAVTPADGMAVSPNAVVVSAERYIARAHNCSDWSKTTGYDPNNTPHSNFGCATARNLSSMIVNPRDLEIGRTPGPASGRTAADAIDRVYRDKVKQPVSQTTSAAGAAPGGPGAGGGGPTTE